MFFGKENSHKCVADDCVLVDKQASRSGFIGVASASVQVMSMVHDVVAAWSPSQCRSNAKVEKTQRPSPLRSRHQFVIAQNL